MASCFKMKSYTGVLLLTVLVAIVANLPDASGCCIICCCWFGSCDKSVNVDAAVAVNRFADFDADGNGSISMIEAIRAPLKHLKSVDDVAKFIDQVNEDWGKLDTDGDGVISPKEFEDFLQ